jgi:hypothetical protein
MYPDSRSRANLLLAVAGGKLAVVTFATIDFSISVKGLLAVTLHFLSASGHTSK